MSTIDERIVEMKFNNGQFEDGVKQTQKSLDDLKKGLNLDESAKSLQGLQDVGNRFSLAGIANGVEGIGSKFSALSVIGITALASIASKAVDTGIQVIKSLTVDHIADGFRNYETQINAVQTILANTQAAGTTLPQVTKALAELNTYANQTVYNFADMTKNIGTFTAAGVNLNTSVSSIKGIANLAAMSGASSEQASGAMYQLSQAIAAGSVKLQDWNSVVNAGIGGKTFQTALENTARASGVQVDAIIKKQGSFRQSLQTGWITSSILTKTLAQFTGDLSDKQLRAMGYTEKQAQAVMKQAKMANDAATQIKTMSQMTQALGEEVGTAWGKIFSILFGDINQAKGLFTPLHNMLENDLTIPIYDFAKALQSWSDLGGRTELVKALFNVMQGVADIVKPIKIAFNDIFPPVTGAQLKSLTDIIANLAKNFKMVAEGAGPDLLLTFKGIFAVLDIGVQVVKGIVGMFGEMFKAVSGSGPTGFLDLTARIGEFLVGVDQAVRSGHGLTDFFDTVGKILSVPIKLISNFVSEIFALGNGMKLSGISEFFSNLTRNISPLNGAVTGMSNVWNAFGKAFQKMFTFFQPIAQAVGTIVAGIGDQLSNMLSGANYSTALDTLNTAFFGGIVLMIRNFLKKSQDEGGGIKKAIGGIFEQVSGILEGVTGNLEAMQQNLKADTLLKIAGALALLAASCVALSLVDSGKLTVALGAMGVMFAQLLTAMTLFGKMSSTTGIAKLPIVAAGMILIATAIDILTLAVKRLAGLDWNGLAKGLVGVTVLLGEVAVVANIMSGNAKGLIAGGAGMILIATAINILAKAVSTLGGMDLGAMVQGLTGVGVAMGMIAGFTQLLDPKKMISTGVGLTLIGAALNIFAKAIGTLGNMNIDSMVQGLVGMGAALVIIAGAMLLLPGPSMILTGAGLTIVASALVILSEALKTMGGMSWQELAIGLIALGGSMLILALGMLAMDGALPGAAALIVAAGAIAILAPAMVQLGGMDWANIGQGLTVLAGALAILAGAMYLMEAALPGAAALIVAAGALAILAPVMVVLGGMSWADIGAGLTVLAGALTILILAGAGAEAVLPGLLGLGAAIALFGVGVGLAGVGILALSAGLTALAVSGVASAVGITAVFTAILNLIPLTFKEIGLGIVALAGVVDKGAPAIAKAIVDTLMSIIDGLVKIIPAVVVAVYKILEALLQAAVKYEPKLAQMGAQLIVELANGVAKNADRVVTAITNAMVAVLNAISKHMSQLTTAGANVVVAFLNGIAKDVSRVATAATNIMTSFINAITNHISKVISAGTNVITSFINSISKAMSKVTNAGTNAIVSFLNALTRDIPKIANAGTNTIIAFINAISHNSTKVIDAGTKAVISFVNGVASSIRKNSSSMNAAGLNLAMAMVDGMTGGLASKVGNVVNAAANLGKSAIKAVQRAINSNSPSKEFFKLGQYSADGYALGLDSNKAGIDKTEKYMKDQLTTMKENASSTVETEKKRLAALEATRKKDEESLKGATKARKESLNQALKANADSIKSTRSSLLEAEKEYSKSTAALHLMNSKGYKTEHTELDNLANSYDGYTAKIKTQQAALDAAIKTRDDYNTSIQSQYDSLGTISADTTLASYETGLQSQIDATTKFATQLQELRTLGLNDTMYKQLLSQGTASSGLVDQLIQQGKTGVSQFNNLATGLDSAATNLGNTASSQLYQAAVDSAAGLLKGLKDNQAAIEAQMDKIAEAMVNSIKKKLGIHSPSTAFAEVGGYSTDGIILGLDKGASAVGEAASRVGDTAITALRDSMSGISDAISGTVDVNPTIKPVLDLTGVQKSAAGLGSMLTPPSLTVGATYSNAAVAGNGYQANQDALTAAKQGVATTPAPVTFNQYNNSPVALSAVEIYRQTKNQLSVAKGVVTNVNQS